MKVREFSIKYDVPQMLVYEASYRCGDHTDFEPHEIAEQLRLIVTERMATHQSRVDRCMKVLENIKNL